jgi:hypothetical protein
LTQTLKRQFLNAQSVIKKRELVVIDTTNKSIYDQENRGSTGDCQKYQHGLKMAVCANNSDSDVLVMEPETADQVCVPKASSV